MATLLRVLALCMPLTLSLGCPGTLAENGESCAVDADCVSGYCIDSFGRKYDAAGAPIPGTGMYLPGGMCTQLCDWFAPWWNEPQGCDPVLEQCVAWTGDSSITAADMVCFQECRTSGECRPGWVCLAVDHICIPDPG